MSKTLDLSSLERFTKSDATFRLTKLSSKRDGSRVSVRQFEEGEFGIHEYVQTDKLPQAFGAVIVGNGFRYLRTSPIVKIVDQNEISTTFETEGGVYLLEKI